MEKPGCSIPHLTKHAADTWKDVVSVSREGFHRLGNWLISRAAMIRRASEGLHAWEARCAGRSTSGTHCCSQARHRIFQPIADAFPQRRRLRSEFPFCGWFSCESSGSKTGIGTQGRLTVPIINRKGTRKSCSARRERLVIGAVAAPELQNSTSCSPCRLPPRHMCLSRGRRRPRWIRNGSSDTRLRGDVGRDRQGWPGCWCLAWTIPTTSRRQLSHLAPGLGEATEKSLGEVSRRRE